MIALANLRNQTFNLIRKSLPALHYKTGDKFLRIYNDIAESGKISTENKVSQFTKLAEDLKGSLDKAKETVHSRNAKKDIRKHFKELPQLDFTATPNAKKQARQNRQNFKELPEFVENKMEPKEPIEEFRVIIFITLERTYNKNTAVQYIINADPIEATFRTTKTKLSLLVKARVMNHIGEDVYNYEEAVKEYRYEILHPQPVKGEEIDNPMFLGKPFTPSFLRHFQNINQQSYEDTEDVCVIKILSQHLKVTEKWLLQELEKASQTAYTTTYSKESGTTSRVLLEFCRQKNISLLGYNQNENLFVKHTQDKNGSKKYRAIVFYMFMNHFYIINDEATVRHLTQSAKEGLCISGFSVREEVETTPKVFNYYYNLSLKEVMKLGENDIVFYGCNEEADTRGPRKQYYEQIQPEILTDILKEYIRKTNDIPKIKMETRDRIKSLILKNGAKLVLEASLMDRIPVTDLMDLCKKNSIPFTNQSFSTFILQLKNQFSNQKRISFSPECKRALIDFQGHKCTLCDKVLTDETPSHIDHIRPLSNGGSNDVTNLQVLCISCHIDKTREEHGSLEHMRNDETSSCFNIQTTKLMNSRHFVKNAFTHTLPKQQKFPRGWKPYSADINKCRRNNLIYSAFDYCKFSVLDSIVRFQSSDEIVDGLYYVETDNYFPMQGNKFYTRPMIEYCLSLGIIAKNQIIYKFIPSNTIKVKYFKDLIDYMMNALDDEECIMDSHFMKKLGPNCLIGCLGRRSNTYFADPKVCYRKKVDEIGLFYQQSANPKLTSLLNFVTKTKQSKNTNTKPHHFPSTKSTTCAL